MSCLTQHVLKRHTLKYLCFLFAYLCLLLLLYSNTSSAATELPIVQENGSIDAYLCKEYDCAKILLSLLNQSTIASCAFYDLDHPAIIDYVNRSDHIDTVIFEDDWHDSFADFATPVSSKGLMHHKFCVMNNNTVLTGSWNPTMRGTYKNDNVVFVIDSVAIAQAYNDEFAKVKFGFPGKPVHVNLSGTSVEVYFCPQHDCEGKVLRELALAKDSVQVMSFTFTSVPVTDALLNLSTHNVSIEVLFEKTRITRYAAVHALTAANSSFIRVYNDTNPYTMHHKTIIIDNATVITGSYNPTAAATEKNDENLLIIKGDAELVATMQREWERLV